eukprot:3846719-Pleurochrysis_carterae.AAC.2
MAACARVNCAEERARMTEEWPGATGFAARPSKSVAEGAEEADLLASASNLALSARWRMTAAARTGGQQWRLARVGHDVLEGFNVSKGISVNFVGAEDGAQRGVTVKKAR